MTRVFDSDDLSELADEIDQSVQALLDRMYEAKMVKEEEDFSQLLVTEISRVVNGYKLNFKPKPSFGRYWTSGEDEITLRSRAIDGRPRPRFDGRALGRKGPGSEERESGADILFFLEADGVEGLAPKKGILAQAKKWNEDFHFTRSQDLYGKCKIMDSVTEHSYALIYAPNGLFVFQNPITSGVKRLNADDSEISIGNLVADFVDCSIGDRKITEKDGEKFLPVAKALKEGRVDAAARTMKASALSVKAIL